MFQQLHPEAFSVNAMPPSQLRDWKEKKIINESIRLQRILALSTCTVTGQCICAIKAILETWKYTTLTQNPHSAPHIKQTNELVQLVVDASVI
jgi:hypothetical protein